MQVQLVLRPLAEVSQMWQSGVVEVSLEVAWERS